MKGIRGLILALAGALAIGAPAQAAPITLTGGTAGSIPGSAGLNEFIPGLFPGPQVGGYFGTQIGLNVPLQSSIVFEFFGAEATFHNEFNFFGSELFDHPGGSIIAPNLSAPLGSFLTMIVGSGLLPFSFDVDNNAESVANGANPDDATGLAGGPNFFATCNPFTGIAGSGGTNCNSVYLFLDDGMRGLDDSHDDFLVRITVPEPVPEPATLGLLAVGLLVLAGHRASRRPIRPARISSDAMFG